MSNANPDYSYNNDIEKGKPFYVNHEPQTQESRQQKVGEYGQEIPQAHTAEQPMSLWPIYVFKRYSRNKDSRENFPNLQYIFEGYG